MKELSDQEKWIVSLKTGVIHGLIMSVILFPLFSLFMCLSFKQSFGYIPSIFDEFGFVVGEAIAIVVISSFFYGVHFAVLATGAKRILFSDKPWAVLIAMPLLGPAPILVFLVLKGGVSEAWFSKNILPYIVGTFCIVFFLGLILGIDLYLEHKKKFGFPKS